MRTWAPAAASASALARPMPRDAPVTRAVLPVRLTMIIFLVVAAAGRSRDDPLTPKIREHPKEHLLGVHQIVESKTAGLAGVGDDIVIGSEYAVRVAPRRNLFEAEFLQSVFFDDSFPDRPLVRHRPREVDV